MPPATSPTRRTQRREATLAGIKATARTMLANEGIDAVSLRAIAGHLGMAAAGVHYYFASRDELLTALIIDAFDDLATATTDSTATKGPRRTPTRTWTAAALRYRSWAIHNPELFQLAHSATATRLKTRPGLLEAKDRAVRALTTPLITAAANGEITVPTPAGPLPHTLRAQLRRYAQAAGTPTDPHLLLFLLQAYTLVHGAVTLAVTGSLPRELLEDDSLFRSQLNQLLAPALPHGK